MNTYKTRNGMLEIIDDYRYNENMIIVQHTQNNSVKTKEFQWTEGMQGNYIYILAYKDVFFVFHNWRGCGYGEGFTDAWCEVYDYHFERMLQIDGKMLNETFNFSGCWDWKEITNTQQSIITNFVDYVKNQGIFVEEIGDEKELKKTDTISNKTCRLQNYENVSDFMKMIMPKKEERITKIKYDGVIHCPHCGCEFNINSQPYIEHWSCPRKYIDCEAIVFECNQCSSNIGVYGIVFGFPDGSEQFDEVTVELVRKTYNGEWVVDNLFCQYRKSDMCQFPNK